MLFILLNQLMNKKDLSAIDFIEFEKYKCKFEEICKKIVYD